MFAKMVLPKLGGSPSVWAVALLFFQGALLIGYCYAHLLIRFLGPRNSGLVHLTLFVLAAVVLPIGLPEGLGDPPPGEPCVLAAQLVLGRRRLAVRGGRGECAVAAGVVRGDSSSPGQGSRTSLCRLQRWQPAGTAVLSAGARASVRRSAAEPAVDGCFCTSVACDRDLLLFRSPRSTSSNSSGTGRERTAAGRVAADGVRNGAKARRRADASAGGRTGRAGHALRPVGFEIGLAFVPAALLTAFTTHISTDIASAPLICVVLPLSIYLLTFVIVFRERPWLFVPSALLVAGGAFGLGRKWLTSINATLGSDSAWALPKWSVWVAVAVAVAILAVVYARQITLSGCCWRFTSPPSPMPFFRWRRPRARHLVYLERGRRCGVSLRLPRRASHPLRATAGCAESDRVLSSGCRSAVFSAACLRR